MIHCQTFPHASCSAVLRSRRNCSSDGAERTDDGRAFDARAAVTGKARSPSVVRRVDGKVRGVQRREGEMFREEVFRGEVSDTRRERGRGGRVGEQRQSLRRDFYRWPHHYRRRAASGRRQAIGRIIRRRNPVTDVHTRPDICRLPGHLPPMKTTVKPYSVDSTGT